MAGKAYSAGTIFLQVVPVFANVQRAIQNEAKDIDRALGDQMEKSGERAGQRAGKAASKAMNDEVSKGAKDISTEMEREFSRAVDGFNKSLGKIDTSKMGDQVKREVRAMRAELDKLGKVDLKVGDNFKDVSARLAQVRSHLKEMEQGSKIRLDMDGLTEVYRSVAQVEKAVSNIKGDIKLDVDTKPAERKMGAFEKKFKQVADRAAKSLSSSVNKEARRLGDELEYLKNLDIGVVISGNQARRELDEIRADLERLSAQSTDIDVRADTATAIAELTAFEAALIALDGRDVEVDVNIDSDNIRRAGAASRLAGNDAENSANSFRSFNIILYAVAAAGPLLVPVLAALAGGLLALGPAAAVAVAGLGAVLVGFSGIGDALKALQAEQDAAATNAQAAAKTQRSAAESIANAVRGVADAERAAARAAEDAAERVSDARRKAAEDAEDAEERVADARESAAEAAERAQDRVADAAERAGRDVERALKDQSRAQERYQDAVESVADAEQALRDAREEAQKDAETLAKRQRKNKVDERAAVVRLFEAQAEYNAVMADGSATNLDKEQASIALEQAQIALNDTRDEQVALNEEAAAYAKDGVDGSEKVKSAQEKLTEALETQLEAQEAIRQAAIETDRVRVEGAEAVAEAEAEQRDAMLEGAEAIRDALEAQRESREDNARAVTRALEDQKRVHEDNARSIDRAREALGRARRQAEEDLSAISSQALAVEQAFDKLGPAGKKFALFLYSLRDGFREFRDAVQEAMLPAVQEAIESFISSPAADTAAGAMVELARGFGEFVKVLSKSFQGPAWTAFFEMLATVGVKIMDAWGGAFIHLMEAFASIMTTAAPFALRFAEGLEKMMGAFADWAASKAGQDALLNFIGYVEEIGPKVLDFFGKLVGALVAIGQALAPYAETLLDAWTWLFETIANMDKKVLGALTSAILVLLFASQTAYAAMNLLKAGVALFSSSIGAWIFAIIGVVAALVYLYQTNEDFAAFVDEAWAKIKEVVVTAWNDHLKPALLELKDAFLLLWHEVLQPFFAWLGPIILWTIENVLPLLLAGFALVIRGMAWLVENVLVPLFVAFGRGAQQLWNDILKPTWQLITDGWDALARGFSWTWNNVLRPLFVGFGHGVEDLWAVVRPIWDLMAAGWDLMAASMEWVWTNVIQPMWDAMINGDLPNLEEAFEATVSAIGTIWDGFRQLFAAPIRFLLERVINDGIIGGYNMVAGWVNAPELDEIPVPEALRFAQGGVLPGYTPGRDPHKFFSPTGGRLELSGGEAIMRPEFTAAVGPNFIDQMNRVARTRGVGGVRAAMGGQAFAKGGVYFPVPGGYVNKSPYNLGHDGMDINHPNDASGNVPFFSATGGKVSHIGYGRGYGNAVFVNSPYGELVYGHSGDGTIQVSRGQRVNPGQWLANIGNTGNSTGPHLHFGFPGGSFYSAAALLAGSAQLDPELAKKENGKPRREIPDWLMSLVKDPLGTFKDWVTAPVKKAGDVLGNVADSQFFGMVTKVPAMLGEKVVDKVWDIVPGWVKTAAGWAGDAAEWVVGGVKSVGKTIGKVGKAIGGFLGIGGDDEEEAAAYANGGVLPYNGTMMYDSGGYLPPGVTNVVNLTGKPEPVFTSDQFRDMSVGGDGFTYAPTIQGSNLTAADLVDDLDFHQRKIRREGRYGRSYT